MWAICIATAPALLSQVCRTVMLPMGQKRAGTEQAHCKYPRLWELPVVQALLSPKSWVWVKVSPAELKGACEVLSSSFQLQLSYCSVSFFFPGLWMLFYVIWYPAEQEGTQQMNVLVTLGLACAPSASSRVLQPSRAAALLGLPGTASHATTCEITLL